jgi:tetratricopeptide (TPR) repeat protein
LLSAQKPVIVIIDDIHWADSASLSLLQYLARIISDERVMLLATFRQEELDSRSDGKNQPLADTLRIMRREDLCHEIKLTSLNQKEVESIAKSMLSGNVSINLVEQLCSESSGNPLFVVESLKMLAERGGLIQDDGSWELVGEQIDIPEKIRDVISSRLNLLNLEAREVLDAGSVVGDKFDARLIGAVIEKSPVKVLSILNSINKNKSLVCCDQDWYRFNHPKTREVLYEEISPPLKKEYHLRVAEKLESLRKDNAVVSSGDLAFHFVNSGNKQKAIKYSLEAGKDALSIYSNTEAISHFKYVIDGLENTDVSMDRAMALEGLGDAYYANMQFEEAIRTYKTLAIFGGLIKVRGFRKAMDCAFFQNAHDELLAILKEVENCEVSDRLENARILMNKARAASKGGSLPPSINYCEEALRLAEEEYSPLDVAWILIGLGSTRLWVDSQKKALAELLRAIEILRDLGDNRWLVEAYNAAGHTLTAHFGLFKEGIDFLKRGIEVNNREKVGDNLRLALLNSYWARALATQGNIEGGLNKSLEALSYAEKTDSDWGVGVVYSNLTMFYSALGDAKHAEEYLRRLSELPIHAQRNVYVGMPIAKAFYLGSIKQWNEANLLFETVITNLSHFPVRGVEANARLAYADILKKQGQLKLAQEQKKTSLMLIENISNQLEQGEVYASFMLPVRLSTDQSFEMRLDLVNISTQTIHLVSIEHILPPEFLVKSFSSPGVQKGNTFFLSNHELAPLSVLSIKFSIQTAQLGTYRLAPQITYMDNSGQTKHSTTRTVEVNVGSTPIQISKIDSNENKKYINFTSESAKAIFIFLQKSYQQDYQQMKLPQERSGWRTLMEIVRGARVSRYSVYGSSAGSQAIAKLQSSRLVEVRIFEGERGRGGRIIKVRVLPEKTT